MTMTSVDATVRKVVTASISGYQRYISPKKGFSCAHRVLHGGESCSQYFKTLIAQEGVWFAVQVARQRFQDCKAASQVLQLRKQAQQQAQQSADPPPAKPAKSKPPEKRNCVTESWDCGPDLTSSTCSECTVGSCDTLSCEDLSCLESFPDQDCSDGSCGDWPSCDAPDCGDCASGLDCGSGCGDCSPGIRLLGVLL